MKRITSRNNASILQRKAIAAEKLVSLTLLSPKFITSL